MNYANKCKWCFTVDKINKCGDLKRWIERRERASGTRTTKLNLGLHKIKGT